MMHHLSNFGFNLRCRFRHWRRAFAYATGRLSPDAAQDLILDCRHMAGWYFLLIITPEDVLDRAITFHGEKARALEPHLAAACEYVSRKWDAGDDYYEALNFALDQARDYAAQDGIEISEDEETLTLNTQGE